MVRRKSTKPAKASKTPVTKPTKSPLKQHQRLSPTKSVASNSVSGRVRRKSRPGIKALRQIKYLQRTTNLLISKAPFARVVREVLQSFRSDVNRIQSSALIALQEAAEMYLVQLFEDSQLVTFHAKRVTLFHTDMRLVKRLRGVDDVGNS